MANPKTDVAAGESHEPARNCSLPAGGTGNQIEPEPGLVADLCLLDEMLAHFSDALALVETAHRALDKSLEGECPIGPEIVTLHRGIEELKGAYTEFDLAFADLRRCQGAS